MGGDAEEGDVLFEGEGEGGEQGESVQEAGVRGGETGGKAGKRQTEVRCHGHGEEKDEKCDAEDVGGERNLKGTDKECVGLDAGVERI